MNFFERQEDARKRSRRLVFLFVVAVAGILVVLNVVAWLAFSVFARPPANPVAVAIATTLGGLILIGGASLYRILSLSRGGGAVAASLGGTLVPADAQEANLRRLRNVVEEMAIAAGVPTPQVYVLEDEVRINAFAAGFTPADAAIAVTRGALDRLNRSELQAVVAHEFGHILNGDSRLNLRLIGWLFGILMLGMVGRNVLRATRGRGRNGAAVAAIALLLVVVGFVGLWFARLIKAGISRQREFLADASSVQYTRNPDGLVGAFCKIAGSPGGSQMSSAHTEEVSHMLFGDGLGFSGWMATHPPLIERIRAIRPGFKSAQLDEAVARWQLHAPVGLDEDHALALAAAPALPPEQTAMRVSPPAVSEGLGEWRRADHDRALAIVAAIPDVLDRAARDRDESTPLLFGLLLSPNQAVQQKQRFELKARMGERMVQQATDYADRLEGLHAALRLPVAMLALSSAKRRPISEVEQLADVCFALSHADGRISLLEYGLAQVLRTELAESAQPRETWHRPKLRLDQAEESIVQLLAIMAHAGHASAADAQRSFMAGMQRVLPNSAARYQPPTQGVAVLDEVWPVLDGLVPKAKLMLIEALVATAAHDNQLTIAEAELLRIVCAVLHAPLPAALEPVKA